MKTLKDIFNIKIEIMERFGKCLNWFHVKGKTEYLIGLLAREFWLAYCAAGLTWCHNQLGIPNPQSAWSPDWFKANVVYRRGKPLLLPFESLPGQVAGFYSESKKKVSHVALIESESRQHYFTIEFNTNGAGSDDGEGVRRLIRKKASVYVIADHVGAAK